MTSRATTTPAPSWISGVGAVTGYGWGSKLLWDGLVTGESAVRRTPGFGDCFETDEIYAALVPEGGDPEDGSARFGRALHAAAREAVTDAQQRGWEPGRTVGIVHAAVLGEVDLWRDFYLAHDMRRSRRQYLELMPSTPVATFMQEMGFNGPCMGVTAMCASGNAALLTANSWLASGVADDVIVVATDLSGTPENVKHFVDLGVLIADSPALDASRPFQEGSRGFVLGEASVGFVLSSRREGAYLKVRGGAMTADAHHVVSIDPSLTQVRRCFGTALDAAGVDGSEVAYLNAHGPGTAQCDRAESTMFDEFFPEAVGLYSVKPMTGHCQGAAAAVELAATALGYEHGIVPGSPAVAPGHPKLVSGAQPLQSGLTVKSSIGMGGHNSVVVLDAP